MRPGQLVRVIDYDAGGGFAPSPESIGIIVAIVHGHTCPNAVDVLLPDGTLLCQWEDDLEPLSE